MRRKYTIEELSTLLNLTDDEIYTFMNSGQLCYSRGQVFKITFSQRCVDVFMPVLEKYLIEKEKDIVERRAAGSALRDTLKEPSLAVIAGKLIGKLKEEPAFIAPEVKPVEIKPMPPLEKAIRNEEPKAIACQGAHEEYAPATWTVGVKNQMHLCDACAGLPKYKKYKKRVRIEL